MKILITGAKGQLGIALIAQLQEKKPSYVIIPTDGEQVDITDEQVVHTYIKGERPDVIINCAAYTAVDAAQQDDTKAYAVNALGAKYLAQVSEEIGSKLVHISTDYVFDGLERVHKKEEDAVNPLNIYGKTKWAGEEYVRQCCLRHFILRTAWLYGEGNNFVRTMLKLSQTQQELNVVGDQYGTPTYTKDLARVIINLIETEYYGTYHASCQGECSWYDFACAIFRLKEIPIKVNCITTDQFERPAKRPPYAVLDNDKLQQIGLDTLRHWEEALADYLESDSTWQRAHLEGGNNGQD